LDRFAQVVIAHRNPAKRELAIRMRELEPAEPQPEQAVSRVIASGESLLFFDVTDAQITPGYGVCPPAR
jgi:hypothetical protein